MVEITEITHHELTEGLSLENVLSSGLKNFIDNQKEIEEETKHRLYGEIELLNREIFCYEIFIRRAARIRKILKKYGKESEFDDALLTTLGILNAELVIRSKDKDAINKIFEIGKDVEQARDELTKLTEKTLQGIANDLFPQLKEVIVEVKIAMGEVNQLTGIDYIVSSSYFYWSPQLKKLMEEVLGEEKISKLDQLYSQGRFQPPLNDDRKKIADVLEKNKDRKDFIEKMGELMTDQGYIFDVIKEKLIINEQISSCEDMLEVVVAALDIYLNYEEIEKFEYIGPILKAEEFNLIIKKMLQAVSENVLDPLLLEENERILFLYLITAALVKKSHDICNIIDREKDGNIAAKMIDAELANVYSEAIEKFNSNKNNEDLIKTVWGMHNCLFLLHIPYHSFILLPLADKFLSKYQRVPDETTGATYLILGYCVAILKSSFSAHLFTSTSLNETEKVAMTTVATGIVKTTFQHIMEFCYDQKTNRFTFLPSQKALYPDLFNEVREIHSLINLKKEELSGIMDGSSIDEDIIGRFASKCFEKMKEDLSLEIALFQAAKEVLSEEKNAQYPEREQRLEEFYNIALRKVLGDSSKDRAFYKTAVPLMLYYLAESFIHAFMQDGRFRNEREAVERINEIVADF